MAQRRRRSKEDADVLASRGSLPLVDGGGDEDQRSRDSVSEELFSHRGSGLVAAAHNPLIAPCAASWFVAAGGSHSRVTASASHFRCVATSSAPGKTTHPGRLASSYASRGAVPFGVEFLNSTPSDAVWSATARKLREQLQRESRPEGWTPADEAQRNYQAEQYSRNAGNRYLIEGEAYALDAERSECLGVAAA